jgi:hypothetical protein
VLGGSGRATVRAIAGLPDGGAIAVGVFDGAFGSLASAGAGDGFAVRLAPGGELRWAVSLAGSAGDELTAVAIGAGGEVAVGGFVDGAATLAGTAVSAAAGAPAALVARLDPASGRPLWVRSIAASGYAVANALAWAGGDLVTAGYFGGTLEPAGAALHGAGALDLFVARLGGADGTTGWLHRGGGPGSDSAHAIAVTGTGVVMIAGSFTRWADLSSTHLTGLDEDGDAFVAAVGEAGFAGARSFISEGGAVARGVAPLPDGRVAIAVEFDGQMAAGYDRVKARGSTDVLVIALEREGTVAWARQLGGPAADTVAGLWWSGDRLILAGSFADRFALDRGRALESEGGRDGYAATLTAAGRSIAARRIGGAGDEAIGALAGSAGALLVGGAVADRFQLGASGGEADGETDAFAARISLPR